MSAVSLFLMSVVLNLCTKNVFIAAELCKFDYPDGGYKVFRCEGTTRCCDDRCCGSGLQWYTIVSGIVFVLGIAAGIFVCYKVCSKKHRRRVEVMQPGVAAASYTAEPKPTTEYWAEPPPPYPGHPETVVPNTPCSDEQRPQEEHDMMTNPAQGDQSLSARPKSIGAISSSRHSSLSAAPSSAAPLSAVQRSASARVNSRSLQDPSPRTPGSELPRSATQRSPVPTQADTPGSALSRSDVLRSATVISANDLLARTNTPITSLSPRTPKSGRSSGRRSKSPSHSKSGSSSPAKTRPPGTAESTRPPASATRRAAPSRPESSRNNDPVGSWLSNRTNK